VQVIDDRAFTPAAGHARAPETPVGSRVRRKDGDLVLTGHGGYLDDLELPGVLHAAVLRSPHPHARIRAVRTSAAAAMPGVRAVLSGGDALPLAGPIPHFYDPALSGGNTHYFRCLTPDEVVYVGEPVAAVAAATRAEAEAAAAAVEVDYEPLEAVLDAEDAVRPGAPRVFGDWEDNVLITSAFREGEPESVLAGAPHVLEDEIRIQRYQTAPLETRGYVAAWDPGGRLTFHGSSQNPHPLRSNLAQMLGIPENRVRVVAARLGGGFGHKFHGYPEEPLVCVLSRVAGAPVKWIESRGESLLVGAREFAHRIAVAYDDDGRILAVRDRILGNLGALGSMAGWGMTFVAGMAFPGPYAVAHYDVESVAVVTNKAPWNGARGYGKESAALALERMVDRIAQERGLDPAEVRRRNFIPPDAFPYWTAAKRLDSGNYAGALDRSLELLDYARRREEQAAERAAGRLRGVGIAFELTPEGGDFPGDLVRGLDTSTVRMDPSGFVTVLTGVTSPGTGNETGIAQVVAAELGLPVDAVDVIQGDTDSCPYGYGNASSRSMNVGGGSAVLAARDVRATLAAAASVLLEVPAEQLAFAGGEVRADGGPRIAMGELARTIFTRAVAVAGLDEPQLEATRTYGPDNLLHVPDAQGRISPYPTFPYSAHGAVVDVDAETGVVRLLAYAGVDDCGTVINPMFVEGQFQGAIAMGIGGALWEELPYRPDGRPVARTFKHYLLPRAPDLPPLVTGSQETPSPFTVLGTKGSGEGGVAGAVACIANAVNDALLPLGVRVQRMPLSAPRVLAAIRGARA
jgi:carbon-monoxide dehydrogenase large subunit